MVENLTLREIAEDARAAGERWVNPRQLAYVVDAYHIEPVQRAGAVRLFARADVARILAAARRVADRRVRSD